MNDGLRLPVFNTPMTFLATQQDDIDKHLRYKWFLFLKCILPSMQLWLEKILSKCTTHPNWFCEIMKYNNQEYGNKWLSLVTYLSRLHFLITFPRSPPAQYSMIINNLKNEELTWLPTNIKYPNQIRGKYLVEGLSTILSWYRTMNGLRRSRRILTSATNCDFSFSDILPKLMSFQTIILPSAFLLSLQTVPKEPVPSVSSTS